MPHPRSKSIFYPSELHLSPSWAEEGTVVQPDWDVCLDGELHWV